MIEPITITSAATAIATIFFTKVIEKPGENLGQLLWDKTQYLKEKLKGESGNIADLLEGNKDQPLDYGKVVLELKDLANNNSEIAKAIKEVEAGVNQNSNLAEIVQKLAETIQTQSSAIENSGKRAEYIKQLIEINNNNGTVNIS